MTKKTRDGSMLQWLAVLVPALAALPAAYFVGRSTYYYLILGWFESHVTFWPALGVAMAVVAGLVVEGLGTVALFLRSSFRRWNKVKAVHPDGALKKGYDKAPAKQAGWALFGYVVAVVVLLGVLEWKPDAARFAPVMFPLLTVVGGMCWSMYDEHRDRLAYHGISWNWVAERRETADPKPEEKDQESDKAEQAPELSDLERAVVGAYRDGAGSYQQVADAVGIGKTTVGGRVNGLIEKGVLERTAEGVAVKMSDNGRGAS